MPGDSVPAALQPVLLWLQLRAHALRARPVEQLRATVVLVGIRHIEVGGMGSLA